MTSQTLGNFKSIPNLQISNLMFDCVKALLHNAAAFFIIK